MRFPDIDLLLQYYHYCLLRQLNRNQKQAEEMARLQCAHFVPGCAADDYDGYDDDDEGVEDDLLEFDSPNHFCRHNTPLIHFDGNKVGIWQ